MPYKFILEDISSRVVIIENHISEQEEYDANLAGNNDENNLHHIIDFMRNNDSGILSSCIYTDVNESKQNLYLKLISTIHNFSNKHGHKDEEEETLLIIIYDDHGYSTFLND